MMHVLFIVMELQVLLLSNVVIFGTKIPLFVLNGYSARNGGYRVATNIKYLWNTRNLHSLRKVQL